MFTLILCLLGFLKKSCERDVIKYTLESQIDDVSEYKERKKMESHTMQALKENSWLSRELLLLLT